MIIQSSIVIHGNKRIERNLHMNEYCHSEIAITAIAVESK